MHIHMYTHIHTYTHAHTHAYTRAYRHAYTHAHTDTYILTYILTYMPAYMHTLICRHIITHIQSYTVHDSENLVLSLILWDSTVVDYKKIITENRPFSCKISISGNFNPLPWGSERHSLTIFEKKLIFLKPISKDSYWLPCHINGAIFRNSLHPTIDRLTRHCYWVSVGKSIRQFCPSCSICQRLGTGSSPQRPLLVNLPVQLTISSLR